MYTFYFGLGSLDCLQYIALCNPSNWYWYIPERIRLLINILSNNIYITFFRFILLLYMDLMCVQKFEPSLPYIVWKTDNMIHRIWNSNFQRYYQSPSEDGLHLFVVAFTVLKAWLAIRSNIHSTKPLIFPPQ